MGEPAVLARAVVLHAAALLRAPANRRPWRQGRVEDALDAFWQLIMNALVPRSGGR